MIYLLLLTYYSNSVAKDSHRRTLTKTVLWRIIGSSITWLVAWVYTGNFGQSSQITIISALIIMAVYYLYERAWNNINWAKRN